MKKIFLFSAVFLLTGCSNITRFERVKEEPLIPPVRVMPVETMPLPPPRPKYRLRCYVEDMWVSGTVVTKRTCKREYYND